MKLYPIQEAKLLTVAFILGAYLFWFLLPALLIGIKNGLIVSGVMGTFYTIRILYWWTKPV